MSGDASSNNIQYSLTQYYVQRIEGGGQFGYVMPPTFNVAGDASAALTEAFGGTTYRQFNSTYWPSISNLATSDQDGHNRPATTLLYKSGAALREGKWRNGTYQGFQITAWDCQVRTYGMNAGLGVIGILVAPFAGNVHAPTAVRGQFGISRLRLPIRAYTLNAIDSTPQDLDSIDDHDVRREPLGTIPLLTDDTGEVLTGRILNHRKAGPRRDYRHSIEPTDGQTAKVMGLWAHDPVNDLGVPSRILKREWVDSNGQIPRMNLTTLETEPRGRF